MNEFKCIQQPIWEAASVNLVVKQNLNNSLKRPLESVSLLEEQ